MCIKGLSVLAVASVFSVNVIGDIAYKWSFDSTPGWGPDDIYTYITGVSPKPAEHIGYGSDTCIDGSASQDECTGSLSDPDGKPELDVCLPTADGEASTEDICNPSEPINSDDICYQGLPSSDQCEPIVGDEDECPGGTADVDACSTGMPPDDECPGGASECDDCNPVVSGSDECTLAEGGDSPPPDCTSLNMDYVE